MAAGSAVRKAQIDHLLATWRADNPDFFWCPSDDSTLLIDQQRGVVGTPVGGASVRLGGMLYDPTPVAGTSVAQYVLFPTTLGIGGNGTFFGMLLVDVPDPSSVTGCFLKIGANGSNGVGFGAGSTNFENAGTNSIMLREGIAWHVGGANAFVKGLNVCNVYSTNEVTLGMSTLNTGATEPQNLATYSAPTAGISINGYYANRTSNATVRAVALWTSTSYTNAQTVTKRNVLAAPLLPLVGTSGPKLWTPRRIWIPGSAGGGASADLAATGGAGTLSASAWTPSTAAFSATGGTGTLAATASSPAVATVAITDASGTLSSSAWSSAVATLGITSSSGVLSASAGSGTSAALAATGGSAIIVSSAWSSAVVASALSGGSGALSASASVSGGAGTGATAAEIWGYVMSNGYTAEENVVAIRAALDALTPAAISDYLLHNAVV